MPSRVKGVPVTRRFLLALTLPLALQGCFLLQSLVDSAADRAGQVVGNAIGDRVGHAIAGQTMLAMNQLTPELTQAYAMGVFATVYYQGGFYWEGQPFQPGQYTQWEGTHTVQGDWFEKAFLKREAKAELRPVGDALQERIDHHRRQRHDPGDDREEVELQQDDEADERLHQHRDLRAADAGLSARDGPRARARHLGVDVAVDDVVVGASRSAHGDRADEKEHKVPEVRQPAGRIRGERRRPPAWQEQQPPADRPFQPGHARIGLPRGRQQPVRPVAADGIGNVRRFAHRVGL